jgi:hypothetical protein
MKVVGKLLKYLVFVFLILLFSFPLWIGQVPLGKLSSLIGKTQLLDKYICNYSIKVAGDSMAPVISSGTNLVLNRCFREEDLSAGTVVLFGKNEDYHLGIIRHILPLDPVIYKISNERPNERLQDMVLAEIVAINKEIDTSKSVYKGPQDLDSLILDKDEYVHELYLGKIPRGYGEEMAEVKKTDTFLKDKDKFCMVVVPKKELAFVDIEIINSQTKEAVNLGKQIVFNVRAKPNINCDDFGEEPGMLNLAAGEYRYRFLLNHQALADIVFNVK